MQATTSWPGSDRRTAAHIRTFDWGATPLGLLSAWPPVLKTTFDIMMSSGFGMCATWGSGAARSRRSRNDCGR